MVTETICISKIEYDLLKKKAEIDDSLLNSLVRGLEDVKAGRVKLWKKIKEA